VENLIKKLSEIQQQLKAPKGQFNKFGNYYYRSCEDIVEAVKPLLGNCILLLSDEMVELGGRFYVKATAKIIDGKDEISTTAFAREAETKKGMDVSQITGSSSSYARKYALNGLFGIDDTKDADSHNTHETDSKAAPKPDPNKAALEKRKRELIAEIGNRIMKDVGNDVVHAQERLAEVTKGTAKSAEQLKGWTFAQVKIVHNKVCTPEV